MPPTEIQAESDPSPEERGSLSKVPFSFGLRLANTEQLWLQSSASGAPVKVGKSKRIELSEPQLYLTNQHKCWLIYNMTHSLRITPLFKFIIVNLIRFLDGLM